MGQLYYFLNLGAILGWVISNTPGRLTTGKETRWATGPTWKVAENLASTEIRSPVRPICNESLYRIRHRRPL